MARANLLVNRADVFGHIRLLRSAFPPCQCLYGGGFLHGWVLKGGAAVAVRQRLWRLKRVSIFIEKHTFQRSSASIR